MPTEMIVSKFKRDEARPRVVDDLTMELTRKHAREACIRVSNGEFVVEAASRYLGWAEKNQHKKVRGHGAAGLGLELAHKYADTRCHIRAWRSHTKRCQ